MYTTATVLSGYNWGSPTVRQPRSTFDGAVNETYDVGVVTVVSAGNLNQDACRRSRARAERAFTDVATDWNRTRASFSKSGALVEIFAPGVAVRPFDLGNGTTTYSGTSGRGRGARRLRRCEPPGVQWRCFPHNVAFEAQDWWCKPSACANAASLLSTPRRRVVTEEERVLSSLQRRSSWWDSINGPHARGLGHPGS
ncbi:alkaline protease 1 [Colletotrichum spaethianum]|uniref:Alkaline protease 1 n=1 Tax=Colletotrichum spaethianum TaxID=700344 RepID=A0AA37PBL3_9PEZI|nr:alkaline protease 1 [Colletotrichum spaethianum]GKT49228.1 alkaline protease 1 [Colletotrichum spaethianum]